MIAKQIVNTKFSGKLWFMENKKLVSSVPYVAMSIAASTTKTNFQC